MEIEKNWLGTILVQNLKRLKSFLIKFQVFYKYWKIPKMLFNKTLQMLEKPYKFHQDVAK
jgi:hypothetical protein